MTIAEYRARAAHDRTIADAVAVAAAPGLLDMIDNGQRLNDPAGINYRDMNDERVHHLVRIISDYRNLQPKGTPDYYRATAALACGHGYYLTDSCPMCDNDCPPTPGCLPLIALIPTLKTDD